MKYFLFLFFLTFNLFSEAQTVGEDFESNTINTWEEDDAEMDTSFNNPYKEEINTSNKVLKYSDIGGKYANVRFETSQNFDFSTKNTFSLKIYVAGDDVQGNQENQISLKLQNGTEKEPWVRQTEIIKPITLNAWQVVTFDFLNDFTKGAIYPLDRTDFNRVVLQVNGEDNTDTVIAYIDDLTFYQSPPKDNNTGEDPVFDNLVWSDEFDGSGAIDSDKWFHQIYPIINGVSWANKEIQHYTNRIDNSFLENGSLNIVAKKESHTYNNVTKQYTSARLNSKFAFKYGKVVIKAKMPLGAGTFPALWMLGQNITETGGYWRDTHGTTLWPACGEIDIIEHWGTNQDYVASAMHNPSSSGNTVNKGGRRILNASTKFHIYTLDWNANRMVFSVDGIVHYIYNPENKNSANWPYIAPQYLLFNVAILPTVTSSFSQSAMEIDYVRVYQEATASSASFNSQELKIHPNPINDTLTLKIQNEFVGAKGIIYSMTGSKVSSFSIEETTQVVDCTHLKKGVYFLKVASKTKIGTFKLLKK